MPNPFAFHPFLVVIFPVLFLYAANINEVLFMDVFWPLMFVAGAGIIVFFTLWLVLSDSRKAGVITSISFFFFFSYGHVASFLDYDHSMTLPFWVIIFFLSIFFTLVSQSRFDNATRFFNSIALILVIIPAFIILRSTIGADTQSLKRAIFAPVDQAIEQYNIVEKKNFLPDIYYIIFDRYASNNVLKEFYDFDNSDFLTFLEEKGFYIAHKSNANYLKTAHSLASSLNFEYINYFQEIEGKDSSDMKGLHEHLQNSKAMRLLKQQGYTIVHSGSSWEPTRRNPLADIHITNNTMPEFVFALGKSSFLTVFDAFDFRNESRKRMLSQFSQLKKIPDFSVPTLTFAHILSPHPPFVFDKEGKALSLSEVFQRSKRQNYIEQLMYTNEKIRELIDTLLSESQQKPIIILQADEGPYPDRYALNVEDFDWRDAWPEELRHKMGILSAFYLPGFDTGALYPEITPVNTFRIIFNASFGTNYELLQDRIYGFSNVSHPYDFFEITDEVMIP